jgi:hypothetical protein
LTGRGCEALQDFGLAFRFADSLVNRFEQRPRLGARVGHSLEVGDRSVRLAGESRADVGRKTGALAVCDGQVVEDGGTRGCSGRRRESRFERSRQKIEVPALPERALETLRLALVLGGGVDGRLDQLVGAVMLALLTREGGKLEQHFAATYFDGCIRIRSPDHQKKRAECTLRAIALALLRGELAECVENARVRRRDLRRQVELGERVRPLAHLERHARQFIVNERSLLGPSISIPLELRPQDGAGLVEP